MIWYVAAVQLPLLILLLLLLLLLVTNMMNNLACWQLVHLEMLTTPYAAGVLFWLSQHPKIASTIKLLLRIPTLFPHPTSNNTAYKERRNDDIRNICTVLKTLKLQYCWHSSSFILSPETTTVTMSLWL